MFFASICRRGFSEANGSGRTPSPGLKPAGAVVRPPLYAGMVPAALPAFSAPTAVSVVPRALASSAVTAWAPMAEKAIKPANQWSLRFMVGSSEGGLEGQADGAAVAQEGRQSVRGGHGGAVVAVVTEVVDVLQVEA